MGVSWAGGGMGWLLSAIKDMYFSHFLTCRFVGEYFQEGKNFETFMHIILFTHAFLIVLFNHLLVVCGDWQI